MILARLIRVCASALLCAGVSLFPGNASADGAGTVVDGRAILKMSKGSNLCALTFDDGPSSHTERLMEILRERGIHATFFVVGKQVKYHPELIVRLQQEGHEIGNHTYSHKSLRHLSVDAQRSEILSVQELLRKLGVHSRYIRPPYGNFDANTVAIAKAEGADIMLWSIDSMDWSKRASIENMKTVSTWPPPRFRRTRISRFPRRAPKRSGKRRSSCSSPATCMKSASRWPRGRRRRRPPEPSRWPGILRI